MRLALAKVRRAQASRYAPVYRPPIPIIHPPTARVKAANHGLTVLSGRARKTNTARLITTAAKKRGEREIIEKAIRSEPRRIRPQQWYRAEVFEALASNEHRESLLSLDRLTGPDQFQRASL